jgi:dephospho-CoA kinase
MTVRPLLIGISGKKRHGKDSVARVLSEWGVHRLAFADHLKWLAMQTWDLSFEQVYGDDLKEVVDERWGLTPRFILQQLGTQVGRNIHEMTWVRKALDTIEKAAKGEKVVLPNLVSREFEEVEFAEGWANRWSIPDCRFPGEAEAVKGKGGVVIKVVRPSLVSNDSHASETEVDNVKEDYLLVNDGSLEDLELQIRKVMEQVLR